MSVTRMPADSNSSIAQIRALLTPASVAVIGASSTPNSFGERATRHFDRLGYGGEVYYVNPRYEELRGRKCYPSIEAIPGKIDTAVVLVGAQAVPAVMQDLARKSCQGAVVLGSGFGEAGAGGDHLQDELLRIARENRIRFIGPNTNGVANVLARVPLGFTSVLERAELRPGGLAVVSQSGSIAASFADAAMDRGVGCSYVLGIGNAIDLGVAELLAFLATDEKTEAAFAFIEGLPQPEAFFDAVRRFRAAGKTLVLLKVGRSAAGRVLAATHSGSIAGSWEAFRDLAENAGALVATSLDQALDLCTVAAGHGRKGVSPRLGVVTTSGALSGLIADEASQAQLTLAELKAAAEVGELQAMGFRAPFNPLDYGQALPNAERKPDFRRVCELMLESDDVDALMVATGLTHHLAKMADVMVDLKKTATKPIYGFIVGSEVAKNFVATVQGAGIPLFTRLPGALQALHLASTPPAPPPQRSAAAAQPRALDAGLLAQARECPSEFHLARWLEDCGLRYPERKIAPSAQDAAKVSEQLGFPVALKVVGSRILHKSVLGLIKLPLNSAQEVADAFAACEAAARKAGMWEGEVMVQRLVDLRGGVEILAAVRNDVEVGPILMVGVGGAMAEAVSDATVGPLPQDASDVDRLIARNRVLRRLFDEDTRDLDRAAFTQALLALGAAGRASTGVFDTVEVNPIAVLPAGRGCWALDASAQRTQTN